VYCWDIREQCTVTVSVARRPSTNALTSYLEKLKKDE